MSVSEKLNDPELFDKNEPGVYQYSETELGKTASGQLTLDAPVQRDPQAQRTVGGEDRRGADSKYGVDDGGHLIGARFGGSPGEENLTPQDRNLNRGQFKALENGWAEHLQNNDKVYVEIESYHSGPGERPDSYMGYAIIEHTDENGVVSRDVEYFSVNNESWMEQESWAAEESAYYEAHPEVVAEDMQENTAMPYIWNEETQTAQENPYFEPEGTQEQGAQATSDYGVNDGTEQGVQADAGAENAGVDMD